MQCTRKDLRSEKEVALCWGPSGTQKWGRVLELSRTFHCKGVKKIILTLDSSVIVVNFSLQGSQEDNPYFKSNLLYFFNEN